VVSRVPWPRTLSPVPTQDARGPPGGGGAGGGSPPLYPWELPAPKAGPRPTALTRWSVTSVGYTAIWVPPLPLSFPSPRTPPHSPWVSFVSSSGVRRRSPGGCFVVACLLAGPTPTPTVGREAPPANPLAPMAAAPIDAAPRGHTGATSRPSQRGFQFFSVKRRVCLGLGFFLILGWVKCGRDERHH